MLTTDLAKWKQRLILEAWQCRNTINEHIAFPDIYRNLKNFRSIQNLSHYCYSSRPENFLEHSLSRSLYSLSLMFNFIHITSWTPFLLTLSS